MTIAHETWLVSYLITGIAEAYLLGFYGWHAAHRQRRKSAAAAAGQGARPGRAAGNSSH
ncbi:hypothetical protein MSM1_07820 [Mycobacterium sp. SM1]|uniref:hypothetical protein n=1 Tax=Mycobacterium sp. SM1 TaxID=2816243 RepID=UPI001BCEF44C|nr:hypothetical protein [Mycobacterium sp. SM1]MBS4728253.1 hypothetical protein [Mycobacterium sp. SM1]